MTHILQVKEGLVEVQKTLKMGDVAEFDSFMSAVIDNKAFDRISGYLQHAKSGPNTKVCIMYNEGIQSTNIWIFLLKFLFSTFQIIAGGNFDDSVGYFIEPSVVETSDKNDKIFKEELFGPVVTAFVYKDSQAKDIIENIGKDTPYALTGAIYSQDQ